jgi:magnesium chelatase accessory protein
MSSGLQWESERRDWPNEQFSRFVDAGGLRWHVQVAGTGPVLLLLHGTGASTHSWRDLFVPLAEHFTVVAPDLPGHAFTEVPAHERLSLPGMTLAILALLTRLELSPQFIAGHSAGAAIALRLALDSKKPPQSVIGINAAIMPFDGITGKVFPVMARLLTLNPFVPRFFAWRAEDPQSVRRLIDGTGSKLDSKGLGYYRKLFASRSHVASTLAMMANWSLHQLIKDMRALSMPVLLLVGEKDKAVPPEDAQKICRLLPQTKVIKLFKTGHLSHEESPETVVAAMVSFFYQDNQQELKRMA